MATTCQFFSFKKPVLTSPVSILPRPDSQKVGTSSRKSGYSADSERTGSSAKSTTGSERTGFSSLPPVSIDLLSHKRKRAEMKLNMGPTKRFKIQEKNYIASTAKSLLLDLGLEVPSLQSDTSRLLPKDSGVDMTTVKHMYSSAFASPFLGPDIPVKYDYFFQNSSNQLSILMKSCQPMYQALPGSQEQASSDSESSTSSVTDPEESNSSPEDDVPTFTSIGDALSVSNKPRYVALIYLCSLSCFTLVKF